MGTKQTPRPKKSGFILDDRELNPYTAKLNKLKADSNKKKKKTK